MSGLGLNGKGKGGGHGVSDRGDGGHGECGYLCVGGLRDQQA